VPEITSYKPGTFCWAELSTTSSEAAKRFYTTLFGWTFNDSPIGPDKFYTMLRQRAHDVGAIYQMDEKPGAPATSPHWLSYVSVASADETAARVEALGGQLLAPPFDVMDVGRMAILRDPTGAKAALWQPRKHIGATLVNEPGAPTWNELVTPDATRAAAFYTELFGWTAAIQAMGNFDYTMFHNGGRRAGGAYTPPPEWGPMPPAWTVYFGVGDCDASAEQARSLGGQVLSPPSDIPNVGRFAILADPQSAGFAIVKLTAMPDS
jgi:predicted enzyme related to lactoylglutathione lyase